MGLNQPGAVRGYMNKTDETMCMDCQRERWIRIDDDCVHRCDTCGIKRIEQNAEQTPYDRQVHKIAEMIFLDRIPVMVKYREELIKDCPGWYHDRIIEYSGLAKLMVAEMATQFAEGFNSVYDFTDDPEFGPLIKKQQIERGLIPSPQPAPVSIPPEYPGKDYQPLSDHMSNEHGLTLTVDEMYDIIRLAQKCLGSLTEPGTDTGE